MPIEGFLEFALCWQTNLRFILSRIPANDGISELARLKHVMWQTLLMPVSVKFLLLAPKLLTASFDI
jgi:hypothetical protein